MKLIDVETKCFPYTEKKLVYDDQCEELASEIEIAEAWIERDNGNPEKWDKLYHSDYGYERLKQSKVLVDDFVNRTYRVNHSLLNFYYLKLKHLTKGDKT